MKAKIQKRAQELGGSVSFQGKTKTFFVKGTGVLTKLKSEFKNSGFSFKKK